MAGNARWRRKVDVTRSTSHVRITLPWRASPSTWHAVSRGVHTRFLQRTPTFVRPRAAIRPQSSAVNFRWRPARSTAQKSRETRQAAKLEIQINDRTMIPELSCDGALLSTPAGSTAYNLSARGPILPLDSAMLALTPISPFRPRRWNGAIIPERSRVRINVLEATKRPVSAVADQREIRDVRSVSMAVDRTRNLTLLFDPHHALDDRIAAEQFVV